MDINTFFKEKLSSMLFLEVSKESILNTFKVNIKEKVYLPVRSNSIIEDVKTGKDFSTIPADIFIEGMFFVLGADEKFRFNNEYKKIITSISGSIPFIKGKIYNEVKSNNLQDAYVMLKGLVGLESTEDNFDKLFLILESIRSEKNLFKDEELTMIERAKEIETYAKPYIYEAYIRKEEGDYEKALMCFNIFIEKGGEETKELSEFKFNLKNIVAYEKGKQFTYSEPKEALKYFIPLLDEFGDNASLYFYIAVCYRILENNEKAIYYLNEALSIDNNLLEAVNEIGINYAAIGNYEKAITYFRRVFEITRNIEVCTNLVMCYINIGNMEQAKIHLKIAKKLDAEDEIVKKLCKMIEK